MEVPPEYLQAAQTIRNAQRVVAFTGAGISVESGIPAFRGSGGLWDTYDPNSLHIDYFLEHPKESWTVIREIFYDSFGPAKPNAAHQALALMEEHGLLRCIITQNIDHLHQDAGSRSVLEFHGSTREMICLSCSGRCPASAISLTALPPACPTCGGLLKPDFVFFGEPIPRSVFEKSIAEAGAADVLIVIGTSAEVMPAAMIPAVAKRGHACIVEVNPSESGLTCSLTDLFLQSGAVQAMTRLGQALDLPET